MKRQPGSTVGKHSKRACEPTTSSSATTSPASFATTSRASSAPTSRAASTPTSRAARTTFGTFATLVALTSLTALIAACDDPGSPAPTTDRSTAAASASATTTASASGSTDTAASATTSSEAAPSTSASAEPAPSASASDAAFASPSGSASAAPVVKGFSFPSPKSGILAPAEADKLATTGSRAKVRVLLPGSEPLALLAYKATKGEMQPLRVDFGVKMGISTPGEAVPKIVVPSQTEDVDVLTEDVDDQTGALIAMLLRNVKMQAKDGIDQETADKMSEPLAGLRGYAFRERVSPHGESSEPKTELPATFPKGAEQLVANMNSAFRAMIPRLPDTAVGTGAKWQVLSREDPSGTSLVQLTEYTLKERSGTKATLDFTARQLAASDAIKLPAGVPEGVTTKLAKFSMAVSGTVTIDTREMAPVKGRTTHDSKLTLNIFAPGKDKAAAEVQVQANVDMKMTVTIARRAAAPASKASAAPSASASATP